MRSFPKRTAAVGAALLIAAPPQAWADDIDISKCAYQSNPTLCNPSQRQVNIVGATLFRAFFEAPASTNDFIDVDNDGCFGFGQLGCFPNNVDQLAAPLNLTTSWWLVQHRSVGSVEGFNEFVTWHLCCDLEEKPPTERSTINHVLYYDPAAPPPGYVYPGSICQDDTDGDGLPSLNGSPVCPCSADLAIIDVVSSWVVQAPGSPQWSRKPTQAGYGQNTRASAPLGAGCPSNGPETSVLATVERDCDNEPNTPNAVLNFNLATPDNNTIFDTTIAFAPVVPISNRGTGYDTLSYTQLQYLLLAGRLPSGENLAAATRDAGSGTRNAWCNSLGVDPSWGDGDRRGARTSSSSQTNLGPCHRVTYCGSSSHIENGVQQRRLAVGYTGVAGSTAAAADANAGLYEILNVIKDIAPYHATQPVRPTVNAVLDNFDPNTGYTIGGPVSFCSVGDPTVSNSGLPEYMENQDAAAYLNNITASIANFSDPNTIPDPNNNLMPGQFLAQTFFLIGSQDAEQSLLDPTLFTPYNPDPNQALIPALQAYVRATNNYGVSTLPKNGIVLPDYGSKNVAGLVPNRTQGAYSYYNGSTLVTGLTANKKLSRKNRVQGDFNGDDKRNANDIAEMMKALKDPSAWMIAKNSIPPDPNNLGEMVSDCPIPEIIGDQNGDGVFDAKDVRYFADGLALVPAGNGSLDRKLGFTQVDVQGLAAGFPANFFATVINLPSQCGGGSGSYEAGDSRLDVAGSAAGTAPGDAPIGADGIVNEADFNYLLANTGDFTDIDQAPFIDLSCDMNGDLKVDSADINEFLSNAWGLVYGDLNCDGKVCQQDLGVLLANYNSSGVGYFQGDLDGNGTVGQSDLGILLAAYGTGGC